MLVCSFIFQENSKNFLFICDVETELGIQSPKGVPATRCNITAPVLDTAPLAKDSLHSILALQNEIQDTNGDKTEGSKTKIK